MNIIGVDSTSWAAQTYYTRCPALRAHTLRLASQHPARQARNSLERLIEADIRHVVGRLRRTDMGAAYQTLVCSLRSTISAPHALFSCGGRLGDTSRALTSSLAPTKVAAPLLA